MERTIRRQFTADYKVQAVLLAESAGWRRRAASSEFPRRPWPIGYGRRATAVRPAAPCGGR